MQNTYLINYSVQGIKSLDKLVNLSFYKKTIRKNVDMQDYNIKAIYGMNGAGKSAIMHSVDILKNLLINPNYLNNPLVQKHLDAMINKISKKLLIKVDFLTRFKNGLVYFRYSIVLSQNIAGLYSVSFEHLQSKSLSSDIDNLKTIFEVSDGEIVTIINENDTTFTDILKQKTINLLSTTPICALFYEKILLMESNKNIKFKSNVFNGLIALLFLGRKLHVYLDQLDNHNDYFIENSLENNQNIDDDLYIHTLINHAMNIDGDHLNVISYKGNIVPKSSFDNYKETISRLYKFLHIFKHDLIGIDIDTKENNDNLVCRLVMVYKSCRINTEFESTGIKKLIKLFSYFNEMMNGGIVFIDELDSNLHDVYLCALLEYLMDYSSGQLCFTTHNVGPMDILRQNKKSIDFLSEDHTIYPWVKNGNYSPANLYKSGMIEGSPFNVDSIDFIGIFDQSEDE